MRRAEVFAEEPFHPLRDAASAVGAGVDGFEGDYALSVVADSCVVLVKRVAAEHAEQRQIDLFLRSLRGHEEILFRRIIAVCPVTAPERVAIGAVLVAAAARGADSVFFMEIVQRVCIRIPAAGGFRKMPECLFEFRHEDVDDSFAFFGSVRRCCIDVCEPVPRPASAPGNPGGFDERLNAFEPDSDFMIFRHFAFEEICIRRSEQCVILNQPGCR